jgi:Family of unknown function (DUF6516)
MFEHSLQSLPQYSHFVTAYLDRASVIRSTVTVWSVSPYTGIAEGEIFFGHGFRLRLREELDFASGLITSYGYEVYQGAEKLYWYDDFPHPHDPMLAATHPHHKHVPPHMKRHRIPAYGMSYQQPNLPALVQEVEELLEQSQASQN